MFYSVIFFLIQAFENNFHGKLLGIKYQERKTIEYVNPPPKYFQVTLLKVKVSK